MALGYVDSSAPTYQAYRGYDFNPAPQAGQGAYGAVPGPIGIPASYWQQISGIYPAVSQAGQASNVIGNQLAGQLSPEEIAAYQTYGAQFGVKSGSPMSGFAGRAGLLNVGRGVAETQQAGLTNYQNMLRALSGTLTPQELAAQIASRNATMRAAPDPQQAAEQQMQDWMTKFQMAMQAATPQTRTYGLAPQVQWPSQGLGTPAGGRDWFKQYESDLDRALAAAYAKKGDAYGPRTPFAPPETGSTYTDPFGTKYQFDPRTGQWIGPGGVTATQAEINKTGYDYDPYADMAGYEVPAGGLAGGITLDWTPEELTGMGLSGPDVMGYYDQPAYDDMAAYPGWYEDVGYYDTGSDYYPTNYDYTYDFGY